MKSHHVDLLNEAIAPALTRLALPIMATSLVQMLYNLTDMAWIGRLGAGAVTAGGSAGAFFFLFNHLRRRPADLVVFLGGG